MCPLFFQQAEKDELQAFLPEISFESYVKEMSKNATYADNMAVQSVSKMLRIRITIIQQECDITFGQQYSSGNIYVGYLPNIKHYVAVEKVKQH